MDAILQNGARLARVDKLLAIRLYRELHGGGLKQAKAVVEAQPTDGALRQ